MWGLLLLTHKKKCWIKNQFSIEASAFKLWQLDLQMWYFDIYMVYKPTRTISYVKDIKDTCSR